MKANLFKILIFSKLCLMLVNSSFASIIEDSFLSFSYPSNFKEEARADFEKRVIKHYGYLRSEYFEQIVEPKNIDFNVKVIIDDTLGMSDGEARVDKNGGFSLHISTLVYQSSALERLLSHEFFHLIHYQLKANEQKWVKEGLATYFEYMVHGQGHLASINAAFKTSTTPLEGEYLPLKPDLEQYGHNYLFFYFMTKNCGGELLFNQLLKGAKVGREGINNVLVTLRDQKKYCNSFEVLAEQFIKARVVNNLSDYGRSSDLQLVNSKHSLPINNYLAAQLKGKSIAYLGHFIELLPSYLPVLLPKGSLELASKLKKLAKGLQIYGVKRSFPVKITSETSKIAIKDTDLILIYKK